MINDIFIYTQHIMSYALMTDIHVMSIEVWDDTETRETEWIESKNERERERRMSRGRRG